MSCRPLICTLTFVPVVAAVSRPEPPSSARVAAGKLASHLMELSCLASVSIDCLTHPRFLIGVCGVPGSGKSTIATLLAQELHRIAPFLHPAVVSMDGWHYPRAVLDTFLDPPEAHKRRGAPFTFDVHAFVQALQRLKAVPRLPVTIPTFDHAEKDPVANASIISENSVAVIIEGNYLCLRDHKDWSNDVVKLMDEMVFLDIDVELAMKRVYSRHRDAIGLSHDIATERIDSNDRPNALLIAESGKSVALRINSD